MKYPAAELRGIGENKPQIKQLLQIEKKYVIFEICGKKNRSRTSSN